MHFHLKTLPLAALSLAYAVGLSSRAQFAPNSLGNKESARIQNIAPQEMWKRVTQCVFPTYPLFARQSHITGTVDIGLGISPKGEVANHRVRSGPAFLIPAAVDAILEWKFQPNIVNGEATWSRTRALARFNEDGTTTIDLARAFRADDFGDPGTPVAEPAEAMVSSTAAVTRPEAVMVCKSVQDTFCKPESGPLAQNCLTAPRPIYIPNPEYSEAAKNAHLQGAVKLSIVVGANGMVQDVTVVQSLGKGLDEKAMEAVRHWKYLPAMKNRQPVETQVDVVVSFKLD
jgi:TonB family protein